MTVDRTRQTINTYADDITYSIEGNVESAIQALQQILKTYGSTAQIVMQQHEYCDSYKLSLYVDRLETDKEMKTRIAKEEQWEALRLARDQAEYKRLKKKFE
jgi:hypothetical protein